MSQRKATYTTRRFHDPIDDVLDRPIAFNPAFKKITGSTVAALMLSQAWYWSKRTSDDEGWFYKVGTEWEEETGLTRSEQETARKHLKNLGIMEEDLRGIPATLYYRIDKPKILELMGIQFAETLQSSLQEGNKQDSDILANINRNAESTTDNIPTTSQNMPLEWQIMAGQKNIVMPEFENREKSAIDAFEQALNIPANWNWYPAKTTDEKVWRDFRAYLVGLYEADPQCFVKYAQWRRKPFAKGAVSITTIKRDPSIFASSWAEYLASETMYGSEEKTRLL